MHVVHGHGIWWSYLAVVLIVLWSIVHVLTLACICKQAYTDTVRTRLLLIYATQISSLLRSERMFLCVRALACMPAEYFDPEAQDGNRIIYNFICTISYTAVFCTSSNAACLLSHSVIRLFMLVQSSLCLHQRRLLIYIIYCAHIIIDCKTSVDHGLQFVQTLLSYWSIDTTLPHYFQTSPVICGFRTCRYIHAALYQHAGLLIISF